LHGLAAYLISSPKAKAIDTPPHITTISKMTSNNGFTHQDWIDLHRDVSLFPEFTNYLYGPDTRLQSRREEEFSRPRTPPFNSMHRAAMVPSVPDALTHENLSAYNTEVPARPLASVLLPASARPDAPTPMVNGDKVWEFLAKCMPDKMPADFTKAKRADVLRRRREAIDHAMPQIWTCLKSRSTKKPWEEGYAEAGVALARMKAVLTP
jgi:hypothetical protein